MRKFIPVAEPLFEGNELKYLSDCIETGWISSVGRYVKRFENEFARYIGCKYGVAVHTGTAALHLALAVVGIGPGDEVIIPTLTFAATANAVIYNGAKPILVDVEEDTWNLDPDLIEKKISERTKAIIPVHLYGHPCDMDRIIRIAEKYEIPVIEDAAEAHGAEYKGNKIGSMGSIGCFSFFGNKIITTGEGGICVCNDSTMVERIEKLRDHGMAKDRKYWHDEIGYNYRMTNLQAAVGTAQLEKINTFVDRKREIAQLYNSCLSEVSGLVLPIEKQWAKNVYWLYTILLKKDVFPLSRDDLVSSFREKGIETRPVFHPLHEMPPYRQKEAFPIAEKISAAGISLPSSVNLKDGDIRYICETMKRLLMHDRM